MPTINDYKKATLKNWGFTGTIQDMENKWLKSWVTPYTGATNDMWMKFLYNRGFLVGPISYRQDLWLSSLGYTGPLPNKFYQFWKNGGGTGAWAAGANISYDFTKNSLPNGPGPFTFTDTHSTDILYPNSAGLYTTAGANVITRSDLGLQTVPTRTNQIPISRDYVTNGIGSWVKMNITPVLEVGTSRTGGTIHSLTRSSAVASCFMTRAGLTNTVGTVATGWVIAKRKSAGNRIALRLQGVYPNRADAVFDLAAGTVVGTAGFTYTNLSATMTPLGDDWYLCTLTATVVGTDFVQAVVGPTDSTLSVAGWESASAVLSDCFLSDVQVEVGAFATPPIVTTGTAVTVNGNQQVISGLGTQLATGVAGLVQVDMLSPYGVANRFFEFGDGTIANAFYMYQASATTIAADVFSGGISQGILQQTVTNTGPLTIAFVVANNYYTWRVAGQSANTPDTTMPNGYPVMDRLALLSRGLDTSRNSYGFTRKLALDFLAPGDDPATKFAEWYAKAVLAAA